MLFWQVNFISKVIYKLEVRRQKKIHHRNTNQKRSGLATLISDKIGFKIPVAPRHKVGHFIMIEV